MIKLNQPVIVRNSQTKEAKVGKIIEKKKLKNRTYYNVQMESGQTHELVPLNNPESAIYIDEALSKAFSKMNKHADKLIGTSNVGKSPALRE